jgi:hypothetical protein
MNAEILKFIDECGKHKFSIKDISCKKLKKDDINKFIEQNLDCYKEYTEPIYKECKKDILFYIMYYEDDIVGYIDFTIEQFNEQKILYIRFSCNSSNFRGQNISILLRCLVFSYAIDNNCYMIISQTNDISGSILVNKFNFTKNDPETEDNYYETDLGKISLSIELEFNCYYYLNTDKNIESLKKNIRNNLQDCKLKLQTSGGYKSKYKKTIQKKYRRKTYKRKTYKRKTYKKMLIIHNNQ